MWQDAHFSHITAGCANNNIWVLEPNVIYVIRSATSKPEFML